MYKIICHALQCFAVSLDLNATYSSKDKVLIAQRKLIFTSSVGVSQQCFTEIQAPILNKRAQNQPLSSTVKPSYTSQSPCGFSPYRAGAQVTGQAPWPLSRSKETRSLFISSISHQMSVTQTSSSWCVTSLILPGLRLHLSKPMNNFS